MLAGAAAAVSTRDRHRHGGHEPQHPPPAGHRDDGDHAAPAQRRPLRARPRAAASTAVRRDGPAAGDRRPARGRDRDLPHAVVTAGPWSATRARPGQLPVPEPGQLLRRVHPGADDGDRRRARSSSPAGSPTASCCTPSSPTRPWPARSRTVRARGRGGRTRPALGPGLGGAGDRRGVDRPRRSRCARRSAGSRRTSRATARCSCDANGWDRADLERFRSDPLVDGYPGAFDAIGTIEQLTHLRDDVIPPHWLAAVGHRLGCTLRGPRSRTSSTPARTA